MKKAFYFFLLLVSLNLDGQNTDEIILQIKTDFDYINQKKSPKPEEIYMKVSSYHEGLFLVKDKHVIDFTECFRSEFPSYSIHIYYDPDNHELIQIIEKKYDIDTYVDYYTTEYYFKDGWMIFSFEIDDSGALQDSHITPDEEIMISYIEDRVYYHHGKQISHLSKKLDLKLRERFDNLNGLLSKTPSTELKSSSFNHYSQLDSLVNLISRSWPFMGKSLKDKIKWP